MNIISSRTVPNTTSFMGDISLLPDNLRGQEEQTKQKSSIQQMQDVGGLKMHVPDAMVDEDIEIIEVDEGDLAAVLSDEPFMTRLTYKLSLWIDQLKGQFSKKDDMAPPPKAPPQFFKPPKKGLVTSSQPGEKPKVTIQPTSGAGAGTSGSIPGLGGAATKPPLVGGADATKARITPQTEVPRRVRVIKRVRKPVRVSLISADDLAVLTVDVSKRKWTLVVFVILFTSILVGGYFLISSRIAIAKERLASVQGEVTSVRNDADKKLSQWKQYEDLEAKIKLLQKALASHVMITGLFDFLEQNTLSTVSYKTASWSGSGQLSLDVVAETFDDAGGQLLIMKQAPLVADAVASGFAMDRDATTGVMKHVTYQMSIKMKPDSFINNGLQMEQSASSTSMSSASSGMATSSSDGLSL